MYHKPHSIFEAARAVLSSQPIEESTNLDEASKAPDVKKYYDDQEDISKQWPISARKQLKFEKQKKGSVELIIVKAPSGQELERYQLVPSTGWTKLGESSNLKEAFSSRYFDTAIDLQSKLRRLFNPSGQLAKEIGRELEGDYSSEFRKLNDLLDQIDDVWGELEYEIAMSSAAQDEMMDDMDPSDFDESTKLTEAKELGAGAQRQLLQRVNGIVDHIDQEMQVSGESFNEAYDSWVFGDSEDFIHEDLRAIVGESFDLDESSCGSDKKKD